MDYRIVKGGINKMQKIAKKGNVGTMSVIAYSIVGFVLIVGTGLIVLQKFADNSGNANVSITYGITQLGSTGLMSWLPAVIAIIIGLWALSYFMGGKGKSY